VTDNLAEVSQQTRADLQRRLDESIAQQTATADILKIISRSTFDLPTVLDTLVRTAARLCDAEMAFIMRRDGNVYRAGASVGFSDEYAKFLEDHPITPDRGTLTGRAVLGRRTVQIIDVVADPEYTLTESIKMAGQRTALGVPLLRENEPIGSIVIARRRVQAFTGRQIEVVSTFADQAVIAIENARLFTETREALERQTATSDILAAINGSGGDLAPVFECILEKAHKLCGAPCGSLQLYQDGRVVPVAIRGMKPAFAEFLRRGYPITEGVRAGLFADHPLQRADMVEVLKELPDEPSFRAAVELGGIRTMTSVPLLRDGIAFGRIIAARQEVRPFDAKQIATLQGFAAQAVIAIENARLLQELRGRTDDLAESLRQQTATADVLKVISRSAFDVQTVLNTLTESAARLCEATSSHIYLVDGEVANMAACSGFSQEYEAFMRRTPLAPGRGSLIGRTLLEGGVVHLLDATADKEYKFHEAQRLGHFRTMLGIPMLRDRSTIGVIAVTRSEVRPFTDKQIELVQTFADQAVIALENVRLFEEVQTKTRDLEESLQQQTATADVLKVISRSAFDLKSVLTTLTESAKALCAGSLGIICLRDGDVMRLRAESGCTAAFIDFMDAHPIRPGRETITGRVFMDGKPVHVADVQEDPEYRFGDAPVIGDYRAVLAVPLMRAGAVEGVLLLGRPQAGPFSQRQIDLVLTFADQAVIAIENVRLFDEVQAKTRDLEEALTYQTGSANILRVIASSPTSVEPVLEAIVESARELCEAADAVVLLKEDDHLRFSAHSGPIPVTVEKRPIGPGWTAGLAFLNQKPVHIHDMLSEEGAVFPDARAMGQSTGAIIRTVLSVPLVRENESIGAILLRRTEMRPFNEKQISLLSTFADQAVIAIENTRLFNETREALERQTATADILKVIASSPSDVQPVFDTIATRANSLVGGFSATVFRYMDGMAYLMAFTPTTPQADEVLKSTFPSPVDNFARTGLPQHGVRAADEQGRLDRADRRHPPSDRHLLGPPRATVANLRRPGGDRDRKRPIVRRGTGENR
jgi:GAF domain-containing protein